MATSPIESQSENLAKALDGIKQSNNLVKAGKLTIPSEPSAYAEWYDKNKGVLEALSKSLTSALGEWNSFLGKNASEITAIQDAEKKYDSLIPGDKAIVDVYRKASTVAATLAQIQSKIQPSTYDDTKIVRNIVGTKNGLIDKKFRDDTTITEAGLGSLKRLGKIGADSIGQEYHMVNYGGDKYGVLRVPKEDSGVVQVAWIEGTDLANAKKGNYKSIRDNLSKLPYANAELDGSAMLINPTTILSNIPAHGKDSLESILATGSLLALEQALVAAIVKLGGQLPAGKLKSIGSDVHKGLEYVGLGSKGVKGSIGMVLVGTALAGIVLTLATDRTLTKTDLRESGFFQGGPTESTDDSNTGNAPGNQPATEITL